MERKKASNIIKCSKWKEKQCHQALYQTAWAKEST